MKITRPQTLVAAALIWTLTSCALTVLPSPDYLREDTTIRIEIFTQLPRPMENSSGPGPAIRSTRNRRKKLSMESSS